MKGQVVGGNFDSVIIRQKKGESLEIGELLVCDLDIKKTDKIILKVIDLRYSSQISPSNIEYISGMKIEEGTDFQIMDEHLRYYITAVLKPIFSVSSGDVKTSKSLPPFFSNIRRIEKNDLDFLANCKNRLFLGSLRSGSRDIGLNLYVDGKEALSHHILVAATTGRGKSNLTSCILWDILSTDYAGVLVLDPHDEYYGRNGLGMKDHKRNSKVVYYTAQTVPPGARSLKINISKLKPKHFDGVITFTDAQNDAVYAYYKKFGKLWIKKILVGEEIFFGDKNVINEATLNVLRRKISSILDIRITDNGLISEGIFDEISGETTIEDICRSLEDAKMVIIDTSAFSGNLEILIGSMIVSDLFNKYKRAKTKGELASKPIISIVLEEAPRVLGKDALTRGPNVFSSIAKEGRKFKVGLFTITQLPSLIPKDILANINTKIILGIEMAQERQAIIDSAAQDISSDTKEIASLDKGEAIISSNFTRFAVPVKIPLFKEMAKEKASSEERDFSGIRLE